ncbi:ice-binding family protein [Lacinutrix sp. Hel_I_90]|uniref:ice-binding family protein n=1 Tax=Lacinutrix sp. Hel_I_90 TaxID=1249999 RepID=UPI000A688C3F|nr:ice-binding family protein [Lacinutrix sp. Hel_I_90]
MMMKIFKKFQILAIIPLVLIASCSNDDDGSTPVLAPTVVGTSPVANELDVAINTTIIINFNKAMDASTINTTSFTVLAGTTPVVGTVTYANETAVFTPISNLEVSTLYTATMSSGAKDLVGISLAADYSFSFTTGVQIDVIAPTVVSTDPLDNAVAVALNKAIGITFDETMNSATFTATSFTLVQGANTISGAIEYANKTARFIPDTILDAGLTYTATVSTDVTDLAGNPLEVSKTWTFITGTTSGLSVVNLGASGNYVILAKSAVNNAPTSAITGHIGLSPAATSFITGFGLTDATGYATSPQVTGNVYAADMASPTNTNLTTAVENMITAYNDAAGRPTPDFSELGTGNIGGMTLEAGLYKWTNTVTMPSDVTISGSADDVWIFQISGDMTMSASVNITLTGGAQAKNIFWQVAGEVVLGTTSHFEGIILSMTGITLQTGASMNGRLLAQTAVILDSNVVTKP